MLFQAVNNHPLIAAFLRRDRSVLGNSLRKRDNLFSQMLSGVNTLAYFQAQQAVGAIRRDINAAVIEHIVAMLSWGQLTNGISNRLTSSRPSMRSCWAKRIIRGGLSCGKFLSSANRFFRLRFEQLPMGGAFPSGLHQWRFPVQLHPIGTFQLDNPRPPG